MGHNRQRSRCERLWPWDIIGSEVDVRGSGLRGTMLIFGSPVEALLALALTGQACRLKKYLVTKKACYDFIVTFDCAYVYFRYLFLGFERMVVGI